MPVRPILRRARIAIVAALAAAVLAVAAPALAAPPAHAKVPAGSPALAPHGPQQLSPIQDLATVELL